MAKGNEIVVSNLRRGLDISGYVKAGVTTLKPGMCMEIDWTVAEVNGLHTFKLYTADADGGRPKGPLIICDIDHLQGKTTSDTYAAGSLAKGYIPVAGDQLNILMLDIAGTGDDHTIGDVLIPDSTTGKFIITTGSPEIEPFILAETPAADPTADQLVHVYYTGY